MLSELLTNVANLANLAVAVAALIGLVIYASGFFGLNRKRVLRSTLRVARHSLYSMVRVIRFASKVMR